MVLLGIVGYVNVMTTDRASLTALIPALFGIILAALGLAARVKEDLRKHLMHAAVVVALIGFISTAVMVSRRLSELTTSPAVISQAVMGAVCLIFVVLAIKSFAAARRDRA